MYLETFAQHLSDAYPWVKWEEKEAQEVGSALEGVTVWWERDTSVQIFSLAFPKLEFAPAFVSQR